MPSSESRNTTAFSALLREARDGSGAALGTLLESCRPYLLLVANSELDPRLRPKGGASDLVQDAFVRAKHAFGQFEGNTEPELLRWLRAILLHRISNFSRSFRNTDKRRIDQEVSLEGTQARTPGSWQLPAPSPSPSDQLKRAEDAQLVQDALASLPEPDLTIVRLRYEEDRSFEEIAEATKLTVAAVQKRWYRAIERLAQILKRND